MWTKTLNMLLLEELAWHLWLAPWLTLCFLGQHCLTLTQVPSPLRQRAHEHGWVLPAEILDLPSSGCKARLSHVNPPRFGFPVSRMRLKPAHDRWNSGEKMYSDYRTAFGACNFLIHTWFPYEQFLKVSHQRGRQERWRDGLATHLQPLALLY